MNSITTDWVWHPRESSGTEFEHGAIAFFELQNGMELALYPRKCLALDAGIPMSAPSPNEFSIGHNVRSKAAVDSVMELAKKAGAKIKEPATGKVLGWLQRILSGS